MNKLHFLFLTQCIILGASFDKTQCKLKSSEETLLIEGTGEITDDFLSAQYTPEFYRTHIKHIAIANGITGIGANAFSGCTQLTAVDLPESIELINNEIFRCSLNDMGQLEKIIIYSIFRK